MQYRIDTKTGNKLSVLGFGCMRFPRNVAQIDIKKTEQLIVRAVEAGINYFDTAYLYSGSEDVLGQIVAKNNLRDKIFIATKMPLAKCKTPEDFEITFQTQLKNLRTDYVDYYLMHNLPDLNLWKKLCGLGIEKWIEEKKAAGQIRYAGFSFHGIQNEFLKLLDAYDWGFCQIQYNYIDADFQAGREGLKKAAAKGLPVIIMEPLLGGKLANGLPKKAVKVFNAADNSLSTAAWGLRWLWNQKEVTVVLSGMSEKSQLEDNIRTAENAVPDMLSAAENDSYESVIKLIKASYKVNCTACNYCMPCPHNINIPACFSSYNNSYSVGFFTGLKQYITSTGILHSKNNYGAGNCRECGACEKKCPQHIPVISMLKKVKKRMEPFILKTGVDIYTKIKR